MRGNSFYNKSAGVRTDIAGNTFLFAGDFWLAEGAGVGDTYVIEVQAPCDSDYTNAVDTTDVSIVAGSTVDYNTTGSGPIALTRPVIKGTVVVPNSKPASCTSAAGSTMAYISVDIRDANFDPNNFTHTSADANGVFQIGGLAVDTTYVMEFMNPWDMSNYRGLMPPATITFIVNADGSVTYNGTDYVADILPVPLGNVAFRTAVKTISGTVTYEDTGAPVENVRISAFKMMEPGMMNTTTDANGEYAILVGDGSWSIMPEIDFSSNFDDSVDNVTADWIYCGMPQMANFAGTTAPETATDTNFEVKTASATITGTVYTPDGQAMTGGNAGVSVFSKDGCGAHTSVDPYNGTFSAKVPSGTYNVTINMWDARYAAPAAKTVIVSSGTVDAGSFTVQEYTSSITGRLWADANGDGNYGAGTWNIGYHIDSSTDDYMSQSIGDNAVVAVADETANTDITLQVADSTIAGTVYDPDGNTLSGVWISTDSRKTVGFNPMGGPMFMNGVMTDADGAYSLTMPAGTYQVAAFFPPSAIVGGETVAYLNPQAEEVTISSTSPATTNFAFVESDATITGNITLDGSAQGAFITAFSNDGGYNETPSTTGSYSLNVSSGTTWFVKAFYETDTSLYYSDIYEVDMSSVTVATRNISLTEAPFAIPEPVSTTFNCANAKKITLGNNAEISIPASAIKPSSVQSCDSTDSSSNITVTVSPTAQMSLQDKSIPVGVGYEITAKDGNGSIISDTFASNVTISIPYSAQQITEAVGGVMNESLLSNGYWDTSTSS